jgi:hypothetical protein
MEGQTEKDTDGVFCLFFMNEDGNTLDRPQKLLSSVEEVGGLIIMRKECMASGIVRYDIRADSEVESKLESLVSLLPPSEGWNYRRPLCWENGHEFFSRVTCDLKRTKRYFFEWGPLQWGRPAMITATWNVDESKIRHWRDRRLIIE